MRTLLPLAICVSLLAAFAVPASAIDVTARIFTDTADPVLGDGLCGPGPGDTNCSLRAAIQEANASTDPFEFHNIRLLPGRYVLTIAGAGEDASATGDLDLTPANSINIHGSGSALTVIAGDGRDRVFHLLSGGVHISLVTIEGGATAQDGGGIWNQGAFHAHITEVVLADNHANRGGAIAANARTNITRSVLENNRSATCGGGIWVAGSPNVVFSDSVVRNNFSRLGGGACVSQLATLGFGQTHVINNEADAGGGIFVESGHGVTVLLSRSFVRENRANRGDGGGMVSRGETVVSLVEFANNVARGGLGLGRGGGIFNEGRLRMVDGYLHDNRAAGSLFGGGGGGIFNAGHELVIARSTLTRNSAGAGGGGGIFDARTTAGIVRLTSATISGNTARLGGSGILTTASGDARIELNHVTVAENVSQFGAALQGPMGAFATIGTVVGQNHRSNPEGPGRNCWRPAIDGPSFTSVADDDSCGFPLVRPVRLEPLADNGGHTPTHALMAGSPALERSTDCGSLSGERVVEDQRTVPRPQGRFCDSGAYELRAFSLSLRFCCRESLFATLAGTGHVESLSAEILQAAVASKNQLAIALAEKLLADARALNKAFDAFAMSKDLATAAQQLGAVATAFESVNTAFDTFANCCADIAPDAAANMSEQLNELDVSIPALKVQLEAAAAQTPVEIVVARVQALGLAPGLTNSLVKQLEAGSFEAVIQHLSAQRGKAIDFETADALIADVRILIGL